MTVHQQEDYWNALHEAERGGLFEPTASGSELLELRRELPRLLCEPLADGARRALAAGDDAACMRILNVFRRSKLSENLVDEFEGRIFRPVENALIELCEEVRNVSGTVTNRSDEFSTQAERSAAVAANAAACAEARKRFDKEVEPALEEMMTFVGRDTEVGRRVRTAAAMALRSIALDTTWAAQFVEAEALLKRTLSIVEGTALAPRVAESLEKNAKYAETERKQAHQKKLMDGLRPIQHAPSLSTINGGGLCLYGRSDFDAETSTYIATYYFVFLFVPILPLARYRVSLTGPNQYRFFGKASLRPFDRWHIAVVIGAVVAFFIAVNQSPSPSNSASNVPSPSPTRSAVSTKPAFDPTKPFEVVPDSTQPAWGEPLVSTTTYSGSPRPSLTYASPPPALPTANLKQSQLDSLNARINSGRTEITTLEAQIRTLDEEMATTKAEIESYNERIQRYERDVKLGFDVNEYAYQRVLRDHNNLVPTYNATLATRGRVYLKYKQLLEQDHAWVAQYNSLLKQ